MLLQEKIKHNYIYELSKKTDDFSDINKIAFVLADEVKRLLNAHCVCVIEYTYSSTKVLASIPAKAIDKTLNFPHELFYILKTMHQGENRNINENDIQSEYLKQYFPLFNYSKYTILPVYNDDTKIITLEIYGEIKSVLYFKRQVLVQITELFQKLFLARITLQKDVLKVKTNETIIKFLDRIRNTLEEDELEKIILEEISYYFNSDRALFITSYVNNPHLPKIEKEYLANPYAKSLMGNNLDYNSVWKQLEETQVNPPVFVIENSEKFIKQNNLENSPIDIFIRESQIKSSYPFLIYEDENCSTYIVLQFTRKTVIFNKNDFKIMELLCKQTHIALMQAKLYSKLIQNSKEEKLLIDLINTLRSSFSLSKIANEFTTKVGMFYNAQRCLIRLFDQNKNEFTGYSEAFEYTKNYIVTETKNINLPKELGTFLKNSEKSHDSIIIKYSQNLTEATFEFKNDIIKYFERYDIKTYIGAFIRYNGKFLGTLSLHFKDDIDIKKHQEELLKALADQIGIAIYQSELYINTQNTAKKEKFLKDIYADTIGIQNKTQLYKYFSEKLFQLTGSVGCIFVEFKNNNKEYFEFYQENYNKLSAYKDNEFLQKIINQKHSGYFCNLKEIDANNALVNKAGIVCIGNINITDNKSILLFFDKKREFLNSEKNLLSSLVEVISQSIKDIMQQTEIKNLRETFLSTLTHDLQVPIVAQRNALEYLIANNKNNDEKFSEILNYLKENNEHIISMIKTLSSIYRYEVGNKCLHKDEFDIYDALDEVIKDFSHLLEKSNMYINKNYTALHHKIYADKIEFQKILIIFFTNILDIAKDGEIKIEIKNTDKTISCCFFTENATCSLSPEEIILDRNAIASKLERQIGEGLNLYLAKLISLAHDGKIYINEQYGSSKIFCLEIPFI